MTQTRDAILDAVVEVVATDGLRTARMEDFAAAAGVSRQLVYYHFRSREHLLVALQERGLGMLAQRVHEAVPLRPAEDFPVVVLRFLAQNQALCRLLVTEMWGLPAAGGPEAITRRVDDEIIGPVAAWIRQEADGAAGHLDPELVARALLGQVMAVALAPIARGQRLDPDVVEPSLRALARSALATILPAPAWT